MSQNIEEQEIVPPLNLDNVDASELDGLRVQLKGQADVYGALAEYCEARKMAEYLRLTGRIQVAQSCENRMQQIYAKLPEWAKW